MKHEGEDVSLKNMEVFEGGVYEGYTDRRNNFDKYIAGLKDDTHPIWIEFNKLLDELKPNKIGISVLNVKYLSALRIIDIARARGIRVMVGGTHPTIEPEKYDSDIIIYQGEYESRGARIKNLDDVPFPAYDILLDKYSPNGYGHLMSSRGCPYGCKFCASKTVWGRKVTFKSPDRMVAEIIQVHDKFGTDYFTFWDETFTVNRNRLIEFCDKLRATNLPVKWRCDTRADSINDEMIKIMKASGCGQVSMGVECGDDATLQIIGKGESTKTIRQAAEILNNHWIQWKAYCIIGFPTDTEEIIFKSMDFIKSLKPFRITLNYFTPYKGTALYDSAFKLGLINGTYSHSLLSHQSPHNYFCPNISKERYQEIKEITAKEIDEYNKEALRVWK